METREKSIYEKYIKRLLGLVLSFLALIVLSPLFLVLIVVGAVKMKGNPFFTQHRPGKDEKIFKMIKFRTMTNEKDSSGKLLPDAQRLTRYGKFLRSTSLDELPELLNIIKGDMSIVGPRPQLVRDMVFMDSNQRMRHSVRQGLTGLAQINGRNNMSWHDKFKYDLEYINNISFKEDVEIVLKTILRVVMRSDTVREGTVSDMDYGDWLIKEGKIDLLTYDKKQIEAKRIVNS